jgi:lipopolysaccharide cholinephosphotransferase
MPIDNNINRELKAKYNPEGSPMREHQKRMLEMMETVDEICRQHGIKYILSSGTLLGAVRHGGFIPWDDDLDIEMERSEYRRFVKFMRKELPSNFEIQSHATDRFYVAPYIKIRDKNSHITEDHQRDINYSMRGIYIDVFPIERLSRFFSRVSSRLHGSLLYDPSHKPLKSSAYLSFVYFILTNLVYPTFRVLSFIGRAKYRNTAGSCFLKPRDIRDFYPIRRIAFENIELNAPADAIHYLEQLYGDYMKLPDNIDMHTVNVTFD